MTTTPDVLLFADGGRASTTAPQRSTLERDHQLPGGSATLCPDEPDYGSRSRDSNRARQTEYRLTRARQSGNPPLGRRRRPAPEGNNQRARTNTPSIARRSWTNSTVTAARTTVIGNLELPSASPRKPPGRDTPARSITNTARLANVKRTPRRSRPSAAGLQLAPDPRPCRTHLQFLQGPDCSRHSDLPDILAPEAAGLSGVPTATIRLRFSDRRLASTPRSHITAVHVETTAALKAQRSLPSKGR